MATTTLQAVAEAVDWAMDQHMGEPCFTVTGEATDGGRAVLEVDTCLETVLAERGTRTRLEQWPEEHAKW